jgi:branched-chain amino acid transport system substrate-binding protein
MFSRRGRSLVVIIAAASLVGLVALPARAHEAATEIKVGALLSITGGGSSLGNTTNAALEVGVKKLNKQLKKDDVEISLDVVDTAQEPEKAAAGFEQLAADGVKLIIGPQSSSEVAEITDAANEAGVLVVSQGSTASSLSTPDDMIFRFVPNDHVEGRASVDLILKDNKDVIVPLWRNDRGNQGLSDSVRAAATSEGATVTEGFRYEPDTTDFTTALQAIAQQVTAQSAPDKVAVYLAGFEEVADVLAAASGVEGLDTVKWYGGDGSAQAAALIENDATVEFASNTGRFPSPLVALPKKNAKRDKALIKQIAKVADATPDAFALAAYDALQVGVKALLAAGDDADGTALREAFTDEANGYKGVTGTIQLDPGGDRASAPYAFWCICDAKKGGAAWAATSTWTPGSDPTGPGRLKVSGCPKP